jgi:hypothetical protein
MTEQEHQQQLIQAKAHLRGLARKHEAGLVTADELAQARDRLAMLQTHTPASTPPPPPTPELPPRRESIPIEQLPLAVRALIEQLTNERNAIHAEKARLSNTLHTIPDEINCRDVVTQILTLREQWKCKQDEIYAVMQTGVLPDVAPAASTAVLSSDPEKVRFQIGRLHSNINKAEKRMAVAKEIGTRKRQEVAIAQMKAELERLKTHLHSL